jgi:hypothetical protein
MPNLNITIAAPEVADAIYDILTASAPHMALLAGAGVYDHVPQEADYPYESLAALSETWADGFTDGFREVTMQWDVWSRYHGRKEAHAIQSSQIALINRQSISLATLRLVSIRLDYADVLEDPDGITWHGVTRYVALVEATN